MNKTYGPIAKKVFAISMCVALTAAAFLTGCGQKESASPFKSTERIDLSGYESMSDYKGESAFVETDVAEIVKLKKAKETFVVFLAFTDCPYCNRLLPYLNEAALKAGVTVGYIDTRKDPSWQNNADIDDYDLFVEHFGKYLSQDEDGSPHLYVPDLYFVKTGDVVEHHQGVVEGADDPSQSLTKSQEMALTTILEGEFSRVK